MSRTITDQLVAPKHPGEILADELEARQMSQQMLARLIGVSRQAINAVIRGKRPFSISLALNLEKHLSRDARFWIDAQVLYGWPMSYHKARLLLVRFNALIRK